MSDDLDIMQMNRDITNFYLMQIDFQLVDTLAISDFINTKFTLD